MAYTIPAYGGVYGEVLQSASLSQRAGRDGDGGGKSVLVSHAFNTHMIPLSICIHRPQQHTWRVRVHDTFMSEAGE